LAVRFSRLDVLLVAMTVIWGANYSVIKIALGEIPPVPFNALRLLIASALFLAAIAGLEKPRAGGRIRLGSRDLAQLAALGFLGHFVYQLFFMSGLSRTSVANSALILGCTPVFVALLSVALGQERVTPQRMAATLLSAFGIYLIAGRGASVDRQSMTGDLLMLAAVFCWSATTVASRWLLARHSSLMVTGCSMTVGALLYLPLSWPQMRRLHFASVSAWAWLSLVGSAVLALFAAYLIWFTAVQRLGSTRTAVYSNLVPIAGAAIAWLWLGEVIDLPRLTGAAAVLAGVALTRSARTAADDEEAGTLRPAE
jgi:drug/metabolite transporter (DMT)-like permease